MIAAAAGSSLLAAGCGVPALPWLLHDGTPAVLRRIGPDDAAALQAMLLRQSRASRRFRFHTPVEGLTPSQLARLTGNDNPLQLALVLVTGSGTTAPTVIAEARYASEDGISAELALIVDEAWRRQGIARCAAGQRRDAGAGAQRAVAADTPSTRRTCQLRVHRVVAAEWGLSRRSLLRLAARTIETPRAVASINPSSPVAPRAIPASSAGLRVQRRSARPDRREPHPKAPRSPAESAA
jgi:hypothetical protein